ncbi:zinc finger CCCH domain-containing protein 13 [Drosophila sechellia]|uniref:zinc finger CCCH domain-containing protein 13 n=1 Tax=Drosophila sechellia TaxID=7238 RepID=UPI0013DE0123|nr:zinc finger CCCH domain-containing protein 13 [Drosophila sechellia]
MRRKALKRCRSPGRENDPSQLGRHERQDNRSQRAETYPSIRKGKPHCDPNKNEATTRLANTLEGDGCGRPYDMVKDDVLLAWQQSPHKDTLGFYGVGSPTHQPESVMFNQVVAACLVKVNGGGTQRRIPKQDKRPYPRDTLAEKNRTPQICKPFVLNRQALQSDLQQIPHVQQQLDPRQAFGTLYCTDPPRIPHDSTRVPRQLYTGISRHQVSDIEPARKKDPRGLRRRRWYCPPDGLEPHHGCTQYEWAKRKLDPNPKNNEFWPAPQGKKEHKSPEPLNYDQLYSRIIKCFEPKPSPDPLCEPYEKCCKPKRSHGKDNQGGGDSQIPKVPSKHPKRLGGPGDPTGQGNREPVLDDGNGDKGDKEDGKDKNQVGDKDNPRVSIKENDNDGDQKKIVKFDKEENKYNKKEQEKREKAKEKIKDKDKEAEKKKEKVKKKKEKNKEKEKARETEKENEKENYKGKERPREKEEEQTKEREIEEEEEKETENKKEKENENEQEKENFKGKEGERPHEKDKPIEREQEREEKGKKQEKEGEIEKEKERDSEKGKGKEKEVKKVQETGKQKEVAIDKGKDKFPEKGKEKKQQKHKEKYKDEDKSMDIEYDKYENDTKIKKNKKNKNKSNEESKTEVDTPNRNLPEVPSRFFDIPVDVEFDKNITRGTKVEDYEFPAIEIVRDEPAAPSCKLRDPPKGKKRKRIKKVCKDKPKKTCPPCPPAGCQCEICRFMDRPFNEQEAPFMREMRRVEQKRQLRAYYRQMRHQEYIRDRCKTEYRPPRHQCDPICCSNFLCRNPRLAEHCDCLEAVQELQNLLSGAKDNEDHSRLLLCVENLRKRVCQRMCDCILA